MDEDLQRVLTLRNVNYLELQRKNINHLFRKENVELEKELRNHVTKQEIGYIDNLKRTFEDTNKSAEKYFEFLLKNLKKVQDNYHTSNKHLNEYIKVAAENLIAKFLKLKQLEKKTKYLFRKKGHWLKTYPIAVFLSTAIFCLLSSTIFHLFNPISLKIFTILHKIDLAGISILNFGSVFAMYYYYFYCMLIPFQIYVSVFFCFCFGVFFISLGDDIHLEKNVHWKSSMYAGLGLINLVPMMHMIVLSFYAGPENDYIPPNICFFLLFLMAALYLGGLAIYSYRFPERFYPKTFDIWLNSHTIWHVFVFLAALTHYINLLYIYESRQALPCV
jgi:adiponectin receptor